MVNFVPFNKIPRLSRDIVVTEKIDGTNASITITEDGQFLTGSRNRFITPESDNYGFSRWAHENKEELLKLGPGTHYGEWWGSGIQRGYGLKEKRFSLFNVHRWSEDRPSCCSIVPVLYRGKFDTQQIDLIIAELEMYGSVAAPGFARPEGIIIFHTASGYLFKKTVEKDESPKGVQCEA